VFGPLSYRDVLAEQPTWHSGSISATCYCGASFAAADTSEGRQAISEWGWRHLHKPLRHKGRGCMRRDQ
jgi:hypothetical protein